MKTYIHVNTQAVARNAALPSGAPHEPVLAVRSEADAHLQAFTLLTKREIQFAHAVELTGPARVVYSPDKPLAGGARVWIETEHPVVIGTATAAGPVT